MVLFDNSNFNDSNVNYLTFDENFSIKVDTNKIKIILGSNGIGKSSIYRNIQDNHPEYAYIDYNKVEETILKSKDSFIIASQVATIDSKIKEFELIKDTINISDSFKSFGLGSQAKRAAISKDLNKEFENLIAEFNYNKLDSFFELGKNLGPFIVKYGKEIIEQSMEEVKIEEIRNTYKKAILNIVDNYLQDDDCECPVCNTIFENPIKRIVKESLNKIDESNNKIIREYIDENPTANPEEVFNNITKLKKVIINNRITLKDLESFIICGGNKDKADYIKDNKEKLENLKERIEALKIEKKKFFMNIKKIEDRVRNIFESQLKISHESIIFDEENSELRIKLTRKVSEYSTGEVNLITFIITLLGFINSDQNTIIIDDPLSSYDIPNQYKIMYEITKTNSDKNCNILILTHNIDCINIANSQDNKSYTIEIMDKINGTIYLNSVSNLGNKGFQIEYLLKQLNNVSNYKYTKYLELLFQKDDLNKNHKLFHFDEPYKDSKNGCSNEILAKIIDDIENSKLLNVDSITNSANKILYLAALRVWIEKKFYENNDDNNGLKSKKYLGAKIIFMIDENHWTGVKKLNKDFLMSKKVLLNQNDHANSQKEPFYYALSITMDDIYDEILEVKNHFES